MVRMAQARRRNDEIRTIARPVWEGNCAVALWQLHSRGCCSWAARREMRTRGFETSEQQETRESLLLSRVKP